jgi:hypothetical protein
LFAALFAASIAWALSAAVDWDWEMPVITAWLFAAGGAALATPIHAGASPRVGIPAPSRVVRVALGLGCLVLAVTPARMAFSQFHLDRAVSALDVRDCPAVVAEALPSIEAMPVRPEPYELLGVCDVTLGTPALGVRQLDQAVARDPGNWEYEYVLAVVRGAAGLDPRPAAARALRLNPREPVARDGVRRFATDDPRLWRRRALEARRPR